VTFEFCKYHGTGNDFILIDDRKEKFPDNNYERIRHLCERRFGIGADGLILLRMHGIEGSMCGNGGRCAVAFAYRKGICSEATTFMAADGSHLAKVIRPDLIQLKLRSVSNIRAMHNHYELDTGSPHYVTFVDALEELDVYSIGRRIRLSNAFRAEGINVNFVEQKPESIFIRTYERGVENETWSCGTGVVAGAICAALRDSSGKSGYQVRTRGGELNVSFRREGENRFRNILLEGPAEFVYQGNFEI
jgi:diaminopimelate epimerase